MLLLCMLAGPVGLRGSLQRSITARSIAVLEKEGVRGGWQFSRSVVRQVARVRPARFPRIVQSSRQSGRWTIVFCFASCETSGHLVLKRICHPRSHFSLSQDFLSRSSVEQRPPPEFPSLCCILRQYFIRALDTLLSDYTSILCSSTVHRIFNCAASTEPFMIPNGNRTDL